MTASASLCIEIRWNFSEMREAKRQVVGGGGKKVFGMRGNDVEKFYRLRGGGIRGSVSARSVSAKFAE